MRFAIFEPLVGTRVSADVAQAWSLLEAISLYDPGVQSELDSLLARMSMPEKRVVDTTFSEAPSITAGYRWRS